MAGGRVARLGTSAFSFSCGRYRGRMTRQCRGVRGMLGGVGLLGRTFEAVIFRWSGAAVVDENAPARAVRNRVERLCATGVDLIVVSSTTMDSVDGQLKARPTGPGRLLLAVNEGSELFQVGPEGPKLLRSRSTSARDRGADLASALAGVLAALARRGVGAGLVLVVGGEFGARNGLPGADAGLLLDAPRMAAASVGPEPAGVPAGVRHLGGGPRMFRRLLDEQLQRRQLLRVPSVDEDPAWVIVDDAAAATRRRLVDALFTLSDGELATRGAPEESPSDPARLVLADGVYVGTGSGQHLLPGPWWPALRLRDGGSHERRVLDLRTGVLLRERLDPGRSGGGLRTLRFCSIGGQRLLAVRAEARAGDVGVAPPTSAVPAWAGAGRLESFSWARSMAPEGGGIAILASDREARDGGVQTVQRLATYAVDPRRTPAIRGREAVLREAVSRGFDALLAEHRQRWARRWHDMDITSPDDPETQLAARFALFQLWGVAAHDREAAVGARGLTGPGYSGHVFWDADVFTLPALAAMNPAAARAMLTYRLRRLPQARAAARARGCDGARFPWESARDGEDVTPRSGVIGDQTVPIRTGDLEEHIVADVAWAADRYATWTGDHAWLSSHGWPLVVETARYWASRCRRGPDGRAHLESVIGPDEYHEDVDDNAYTNVMARWNLRRGADLLERLDRSAPEPATWRELAACLVDGYDERTGLYEQFVGYHRLEPLSVAALGRTPPVAADLLLDSERLSGSQVVKQADVLMLYHLVPEEVVPGSLGPNLDYYLPRTAHGSSLSPAVTASVLARAGRPAAALDLLRLALRVDLDDMTGATASGLHIAAMAGAWQALVHGFAGVRVRAGALDIDPCLPPGWARLGLRLRCLGRRVGLQVHPDEVRIDSDGPIRVSTGTGVVTVSGRQRLERDATGWQVKGE